MQIIDALVAEPFFADCRTALSDNGIFVTNWWSGDKRYPLFLQRLAQVFEQRVLCVPAETHGNVAVLAFQNQAPQPLAALQKKAAKLSEQYGLDFKTMLHQARAAGQHLAVAALRLAESENSSTVRKAI